MNTAMLIYESGTFGHRIEYIEYFMEYLKHHELETQLVFLINKKTIDYLNELIEQTVIINNNVIVLPIENSIQDKIDSIKSIFQKSIFEKKLIERYAEKYNIVRVLFLQIDSFQYLIGRWQFSKFKKLQISGILFAPYVQLPNRGFSDKITFFRKKLQITWMLLNKNIKSVFIFNDDESVKQLNTTFSKNQLFKYLPDPIKIRSFKKIDIRTIYGIQENSKILLSVGGIERRKNIVNIIKAISLLDKDFQNNLCLLIFGKCEDVQLLDEVNIEIRNVPECQIILDSKYLSTDELESALYSSDLAFVVYSNFYPSSGILGNAAKHNKFIIASNEGVIGNLTRRYNLGITVNPESISEISRAIHDFILKKISIQMDKNFIISHSEFIFCEYLLKTE